MISLQLFWFVIAALWINSIQGEDACEFANINFKNFVAGINGKVKSSEPLHVDIIDGEIPTLKYTVSDADLAGMKDCEVAHTQCDSSNFQYYIQCPQMILTSKYKSNGMLNTLQIQGEGDMTVKMADSLVMLNGKYEKIVGKDQKSYPIVKNFNLDIDIKGDMSYKFGNLFNGDKERSEIVHKFFNENAKEVEKIFEADVMGKFFDVLFDNLNDYSKAQ